MGIASSMSRYSHHNAEHNRNNIECSRDYPEWVGVSGGYIGDV